MNKNKSGRGGAREGAGRPSLYGGKKRAITISLLTDTIDRLSREAEKTGISRSDIINKLVLTNIE